MSIHLAYSVVAVKEDAIDVIPGFNLPLTQLFTELDF
jgi:hypothetical protein